MKQTDANYLLRSRCVLLLFAGILIAATEVKAGVKSGLDVLLSEKVDMIAGKRIGVIANQASVDSRGKPIVELLSQQATVAALFGPEHGFEGTAPAGASVGNLERAGIKIFSLYGTFHMPTSGMLKNVDLLVYDIQDVGVKFYTYISSLFLCLCAAEREKIPILVLDRPDPIGADRVEGAITNPAYASIVGVMPLPTRYGMTVGELATLFNEETYAGFGIGAKLTVIEMKGYRRNFQYEETGLPWVPPSPNMPTLETAAIYPGMCLLEGTNLSEGRGTESPFLTVGAPFIDAPKWREAIPQEALTGVQVETVTFTPRPIQNKVDTPKHNGKPCNGLRFHVTDCERLRPIELAVALLCAAQKLDPAEFKMTQQLDRLWGNEELRAGITEGADYIAIMKSTQKNLDAFKKVRKKYLRYP